MEPNLPFKMLRVRVEVYFSHLQTFVRKWRYFSIATYFGTMENSNYVWSLSLPSPMYAYTLPSSMADCVRGPSGPERVGPGTREVPREPQRNLPTRSYTL